MDSIVLNFDDKITESPGEITGFILMYISLFLYFASFLFIILLGIGNHTVVYCFVSAVSVQIFIPIGGMIEVCFSGNGTLNQGFRNAMKGASLICWCCCYDN